MVAGTLALATPSLALAEDEVPCIAISGELRSQAVPTPPCTSPIGLCTTGEFSGSFPAQFDFRGDAISAIDPSQPFLQQYTGDVTLTTDDGDQV
ncbi:MAG TPA: hypothetical protein VEY30_13065, partial [Myxococcaceae bacterium]|nr:hypothetical protein [Myxococcaceae bacterium]